MFVNGKEIFRFKVNNGSVNFPTQFCLGSISNKFSYDEAEEVSLIVHDFSVDCDAIKKSYLFFFTAMTFFGCNELNVNP